MADTINVAITEETIAVSMITEVITLEMTAGVSWNQIAGKPTPVAESTFIVSNSALAWVVKTLTQVKTILGIPSVTADYDFQVGSSGSWIKKTLAEVKTILGVGSSDTEKVRYDVDDLAAGYLADKIIAGTGISLSEGAGADENKLKITSTAVGTDEKVKYDAGDPAAGYFSDKLVAGSGISIAEGTAENENKSVVTNSDLGSTAISGHNIAFNHGNIHASGSDNETATSIIALGIDEIEFAVIKSYMI